MTALPRVAAIPAALFYGVVAAMTLAGPWVLLLGSSKSPLRAHDTGYIDGFAMGVFFVFFQLLGVGFGVGAVSIYRHRQPSAAHPAP